MTNFSELRVFLCMTPTSMNFSFDRLMGLAERIFNQDPLSGHLFLFVNRYRNRIRILYWDRDGYVLTMKRLEQGRYRIPWRSEQGHVIIEAAELLLVLEGIDVTNAARRKRWSPRHAAA